MGRMINRILIANRGEIAVRIMRTARRMGISTVAIYSEPDSGSLHVAMADESHFLDGTELRDTYLSIPKIIEIALKSKCDAVHPGYGFLSENAAFVRACDDAGLIFIGPGSDAMNIMGNKIRAREFAVKTGIPVTAGITGSKKDLLKSARNIPFPLLLKAAAGGGGKGMRIVRTEEELEEAIEATARQALAYFGDETVYIEQYIEEPRHIEIQVLGDMHGNVIHLFERECSIQRRYQKIIEESPSPTLTPEVREKMGEAAVRIGKEIGYSSAGTIEFLVDQNLNYYFLEMNTRIQVEHPVTEMVTGVDIVEEQIHIASGQPLRFKQEDIRQNGHAIECRIYAEDPENNFLPSPGTMTFYKEPETANTRIDTGIKGKTEISPNFDPMISKLVLWGQDREEATRIALSALHDYIIHGIQTNISYLLELLQSPMFSQNKISTKFCDEHTGEIVASIHRKRSEIPYHIPVAGFLLSTLHPAPCDRNSNENGENVWSRIGYWRNMMTFEVMFGERPVLVRLLEHARCASHLLIDEIPCQTVVTSLANNRIDYRIGSDLHHGYFSGDPNGRHYFSYQGYLFAMRRADFLPEAVPVSYRDAQGDGQDHVSAPMPGKVIRIKVSENQEVRKGDVLLILEAMKMENSVTALRDAKIKKINVTLNQAVEVSTPLIEFEKQE